MLSSVCGFIPATATTGSAPDVLLLCRQVLQPGDPPHELLHGALPFLLALRVSPELRLHALERRLCARLFLWRQGDHLFAQPRMQRRASLCFCALCGDVSQLALDVDELSPQLTTAQLLTTRR